MNQTKQSAGPLVIAAVLLIALCVALALGLPAPRQVLASVAAAALIFMLWHHWGSGIDDFIASDIEDDQETPQAVNPWEMQRELMRMSSQAMPALPRMNDTSLLYGALTLEEVGETSAAVAAAISACLDDMLKQGKYETDSGRVASLGFIKHQYVRAAQSCDQAARNIRAFLGSSDAPQVDWELPADLAHEILDGSTDVSVTNSGFCAAWGLPGDQAYLEVYRSNKSKANPETGVIDKTADGKWIKGKGFFKPNLHVVLNRAREAAWLAAYQADTARAQGGKHQHEIPSVGPL